MAGVRHMFSSPRELATRDRGGAACLTKSEPARKGLLVARAFATRVLLPASGEKVAGRPDEGRAVTV
jgi:hypothetical protein